ncbi:MAG TPA: PepSY domain-containing protein [Candidatus Bilamarchaeum sp.]|nr:PepSY domain-containing protein [Candidatus Bilamarchaeum sp.]
MVKIIWILLAVVLAFSVFGCAQAPKPQENLTNITPTAPNPPPVPPQNATPPATPPPSNQTNTSAPPYNPEIRAQDFTSNITNKYFSLTPGKKMVFESQTEDGLERAELFVTSETRMVMGVRTVVVWDRVWLEGDLIEDTRDYYAQDREGSVWYFGEDTKELSGGVVTTTSGSWEAGVDGAKPGIIMLANPEIGRSYLQEYYAGEAEDTADVLSLNESVSVPYGNFTGCIKTRDWTPLEPGADEHKFYCADIGGVALEIVVEDGEREELVSVEYGASPSPSVAPAPETKANITEQEARQIALERVPGKVTDVEMEKKFGKLCYVIQIDADSGPETDVIIDRATGEVLAVET